MDVYMNRSVIRAIRMLEVLSRDDSLTLEEISDSVKVPRTTTYRLLTTLERLHYVQRKLNTSGSYVWSLGLQLLILASSKISQLDIRSEIRDLLEDLARETDEFVQLAVLHNDQILFLDVIKRRKPLATYADVGSQLSINVCAAGLVLAAFLEDKELERILKTQVLPKNTPKTPTTGDELRKTLREVVRRGYSIDDEYYSLGHRCIGAPIYNHDGKVMAAINISGSTSSITGERMPVLIRQVVGCAYKASLRIGYRPQG